MGSETPNQIDVFGWGAKDTSGTLAPITFKRRATGAHDVKLRVKFCGVCHSDWSTISGEWGTPKFPLVPGHEIVGVVEEIGSEVTRFKLGDHVGVSTYVDSCGSCSNCGRKVPQHCRVRPVWTYNDVHYDDEGITYGGYSQFMVVDENFVLSVPEKLPLDGAAPLLCAGATVWSPMKRYGMGADRAETRFGVVGLGGLGHMACKFAKALGWHLTVLSSSPSKEKLAMEDLDADRFIVTTDTHEMKLAAATLDFIIDTVSALHSFDPFIKLLDAQGQLIFVGGAVGTVPFTPVSMLPGAKSIGSSCIASQVEMQEMLDFCGANDIVCDVEIISIDYIHEAFKRLNKSDVHFRFVIDVENTMKPPASS